LNLEQSIHFIPGLTVKGTVAFDPNYYSNKTWAIPVKVGTVDRTSTPYKISENVIGNTKPSLTENWTRGHQLTYQAGVDYKNTFGQNYVEFVGVFEAKANSSAEIALSRRNYNLYIDEINMGSSSNADMTTN